MRNAASGTTAAAGVRWNEPADLQREVENGCVDASEYGEIEKSRKQARADAGNRMHDDCLRAVLCRRCRLHDVSLGMEFRQIEFEFRLLHLASARARNVGLDRRTARGARGTAVESRAAHRRQPRVVEERQVGRVCEGAPRLQIAV